MELLKELIAATVLVLILSGASAGLSIMIKTSQKEQIMIEKFIEEQHVMVENEIK